MKRTIAIAAVVLAAACWPAAAQHAPDAAGRIAAQKEALARLAALDGTWRGEAWTLLPSGEKHTFTQTERVGPFLDGAVRVIEGRGFDADGRMVFNAFAIVSFDPDRGAYLLRSYAQGRSGDFALTPTADGFTWEIAAGPATIRYTATVKDGTWHEVGDRIVGGGAPVRFMEMTLKRLGDTDWPSGGAVPMK